MTQAPTKQSSQALFQPPLEAARLAGLKRLLLESLRATDGAQSPYQLLKQLQTEDGQHFQAELFRDPLTLFRANFILFHLLYRLQTELRQQQQGYLAISPMWIEFYPVQQSAKPKPESTEPNATLEQRYQANHPATDARVAEGPLGKLPGVADPLAAFYLDWANYQRTDAKAVEQLLASFWRRLSGEDRQTEALTCLGLSPPCDWPSIQNQYRRLAMRLHPDRGGDAEQLITVNEAYAQLKSIYQA